MRNEHEQSLNTGELLAGQINNDHVLQDSRPKQADARKVSN